MNLKDAILELIRRAATDLSVRVYISTRRMCLFF